MIFSKKHLGFYVFAGVFLFCLANYFFTIRQDESYRSALPMEKGSATYQYAAPWNKEMFEVFYAHKSVVPENIGVLKGGIVPHHLVAGTVDAAFFDTLARQRPSVIVLIGPNHFDRGRASIITTDRDWQTPYGILRTNHAMVHALKKEQLVVVDEITTKEEHSIYGVISFIKKSLPETTVLPLILRSDTSTTTLRTLVVSLVKKLPKDAVIVASIDFSHYQSVATANFHDELSIGVIHAFDYDRLSKLEIDSFPSLYAELQFMEAFHTQKIAFALHTNSGLLGYDPMAVDTTSHYSPYFVTGPKSPASVVSILSFGDMMLDRGVKKQIDAHGAHYPLQLLAGNEERFFSGMDVVSANLEGPFVHTPEAVSQPMRFAFDSTLIPMLKHYHFSLLSQANNHSFDMGQGGFDESRKLLASAGIHAYGNPYQLNNESVYMEAVGGKQVAFIGLNDIYMPLNPADVRQLIQTYRGAADIVIVNIHWGEEYRDTSTIRQQTLAHIMIDAGADVIVGHHPHVVQEMEVYQDRPIFYSLGNFIFDQDWSRATQEELGVGLVFHDTHLSIYFFPLLSEQGHVRAMSKFASIQFMKKFVDKSDVGSYTINTFSLILPYGSKK